MKEFANYISDGIVECKIVKDKSNKIDIIAIYANKQTEIITGKTVDEILNKKMKEVFPAIADSIFDWPIILSEAAMTSEHKIIEQYVVGFDKYVRFSVFGFKEDTFYIAMQDMTEKKETKRILLEKERVIRHLENEIKARANTDMLTNLYNFQFMNESIKSSISSYVEEDINFCLLVLDIDDFKKINKMYGMDEADNIIHDVANILSANARKIDVVGRYGNDKFMIILNNVDIDIAKILTEKIKKEIESYSLKFNNNLSACGSIVEYGGETIEEFIEKSEILTTKAQSMGKGIILS
ncbi:MULTISPECIES: sensor domain-containing diguanylate cyclase [unclassified Sedimentibacter]|uniref:sensor domain-containing diguanylate cyclase n=1 Tax=unclassified Sedimentibacter TaxID=2649220 RepID=UPI0027E1BF4F|nr:GGDEF domain-containing protein [Sedimentibacter sp. MB35-C1]WMJ77747.1 GGDEF domain-containing protein [Sedimentibacter sp. MB35-C1]